MTDNKADNTESSQQPSADHPESVSQPGRGLLGSSFIVSVGTMLSRVLGLVRDVALANLLGAAPNADAFFVAFKIPNFLRRLLPKAHSHRRLCQCSQRRGSADRMKWSVT